jgi:hypothetical protein
MHHQAVASDLIYSGQQQRLYFYEPLLSPLRASRIIETSKISPKRSRRVWISISVDALPAISGQTAVESYSWINSLISTNKQYSLPNLPYEDFR